MIEVARRTCWIRLQGDDEPSPLSISFLPAREVEGEEFRAAAMLRCKYFERELFSAGADGLQALSWIFLNVHSYLLRQQAAGFEIYWTEPGDLDHPTFWGVNLLPTGH